MSEHQRAEVRTMAKFTRKAIMQAFMYILKTTPLDKITVKDICETCELNRNTFYYYFKDIYDVLETIFDEEAKLVLEEVKDGGTFYEAYARCSALLINNREAVMHIYASENGKVLGRYLEVVVAELVRRFVIEKAQGYDLDETEINFITYFYANAIVGSTIRWIEKGMKRYNKDMIRRISEAFEVTIYDMIECSSTNS